MSDELYSTNFVDAEGNPLGDASGLLPIPLFKGMQITIHGHSQSFTVVDWKFHHGQPDEKSGLTIVLK